MKRISAPGETLPLRIRLATAFKSARRRLSSHTLGRNRSKNNAGVDEHQHQHYVLLGKQTFDCLHLYVAFCRLNQLLLKVVDVIQPLNRLHLLTPVFVDKTYAFVIQVVEVQSADGSTIVVVSKDGKI